MFFKKDKKSVERFHKLVENKDITNKDSISIIKYRLEWGPLSKAIEHALLHIEECYLFEKRNHLINTNKTPEYFKNLVDSYEQQKKELDLALAKICLLEIMDEQERASENKKYYEERAPHNFSRF